VVLIISSFTPIRFFGILVVVSIFSCLVGALVILPAIILRVKPRFLEPKEGERRKEKVKSRKLRALRRIAMGLIVAAFTAVSVNAQNPKEIVKKSHDVVKVSSFEAISTLTITDSKGNQRIRKNSMASVSEADGTEKRIIKFMSPADVKGTGILIYDYPEKSDDMWIYLPALRKTRRIVSKEKSKSFMGSEFSNANMTAPGLEDFSYALKGEETLNGNICFLIESTPVTTDLEDEYGYARSVSWVDKNSYLVHQTLYYDFDGELSKTIENREFQKLDEGEGKYMVTRMFANNHSKGRSSEMIMDQVAVTSTNKDYFTVAYLEKE
jgi:outer membrane lipoprotein-sorting protein